MVHLPKIETARPQEHSSPDPARYVLPTDVRNSVRHLSDGDLDVLLQACVQERERRGAPVDTRTLTPKAPRKTPAD